MNGKPELETIRQAIEQVRGDLTELEEYPSVWDSKGTRGFKTYRLITRRIVLSAQRIQVLVKENTLWR